MMNQVQRKHKEFTDELNKKRLGILEYGIPDDRYFRYRSCQSEFFDSELEQALNGYFYYTSVDQVNDPFDARPIIEKGVNLREFRESVYPIWEHLCMMHEYFDVKESFTRESFRQAQRSFKQPRSRVIGAYEYGFEKYFLNTFQERTNMLCLSKTCSNNVMWSMYASRFNGICLELGNISKIFDDHYILGPVKVQYEEDRPKFDYQDAIFLLCDWLWSLLLRLPDKHKKYLLKLNPRIDAFHTKQLRWAYEEEYRLLNLANIPGYNHLNSHCVKSITIGHEVSDSNRKLIRDVVNRIAPGTSLFVTELSSDSFDVVRLPFLNDFQ